MTPGQMWENYIRPMGAGAVAMAGLITLMKTMPTIVNALRERHEGHPLAAGRRRRPARAASTATLR